MKVFITRKAQPMGVFELSRAASIASTQKDRLEMLLRRDKTWENDIFLLEIAPENYQE